MPQPALGAGTYYVSAAGDDKADGRTEGAALATLAEAARRAQTGDRILLRRGDVFRESVAIATPGIEVDAYGPADAQRPVVSGGVPITGWQPYKGSIYVAQTQADAGYLYVNGKLMTIARYPNTGWLRTKFWRTRPAGADRQAAGNHHHLPGADRVPAQRARLLGGRQHPLAPP